MQREYLGDSVYVETTGPDGYYLTLTTDNGEGPTNTIHLEPRVIKALWDYRTRMREEEKKRYGHS